MTSRFVTFSTSDPELQSYLLGTFSKTHRAKPLQKNQHNLNREVVTFELVPKGEISRPGGFSFVYQWLRMSRLIFVLFPLFFVIVGTEGKAHDPETMLAGIFGLIFLTWSIHLQNDYSDHLQGVDRISMSSGSRAIQNGWVTARTTQLWSRAFGALALILGSLIILSVPQLGPLALLVGGLVYLSHYSKKAFFKNRVWGGWLQGFLIGPALAVGLELLLKNRVTGIGMGFGFVWGVCVLFVLFLSEYENLVYARQVGFKTWLGSLGFDRGRLFLGAWCFLLFLAYISFHAYTRPWVLWLPAGAILIFFSGRFLRKLKRLSSPAGSGMLDLRVEGYQLFLLTITLWTIEEILFGLMSSLNL